MNSVSVELATVSNSQHGLASAKIQLSLLNRLLLENPSLLSDDREEKAEIAHELANVSSLTHLIGQKIDLLYRRVSLEFQLPVATAAQSFDAPSVCRYKP